jgi:hypothetical protein
MIIAALLTPLLVTASPAPVKAADVGLSIRIGDRYRGDQLRFQNQPRFTTVPGTRVYYVRDSNMDVYRYGGWYYANESGRWYRASSYRGPWTYVRSRAVPRQIFYVPTNYRRNWHGDYGYWRNRDYDRDWDRRDRSNGQDRYQDTGQGRNRDNGQGRNRDDSRGY